MNISHLFLILLLLHIQGFVTQDPLLVTCGQQKICSLRGSEVTLKCGYYTNFKHVFWFSQKQSSNWRSSSEPEDLTLDSDYSGRVKQRVDYYRSSLVISDLRERDAGEYQLMFIMTDGVQRLGSVTVSLTVTDLQVRMNPASTDQRDQRVQLTCDTSCDLPSAVQYYYWKKNKQNFRYTGNINTLELTSTDTGSYSCHLHGKLAIPSSSVCLSKSGCWNVTYTSRRVCALKNSTVDISCTYSHPSNLTIVETFWHYVQPGAFKDLREERQVGGRVEYVKNTLRIKELKMSDSREYRFRIITRTERKQYSGSPGVILTVTDAQVTSSPSVISGREAVILSCSTKCTLEDKHTYIWFRNGQQVMDGFTKANKLYLDSVSREELQEFSCAVGGLEESRALRNIAVILCVFLTLALIGVLWYRRRRYTLAKVHSVEKEDVMYDSVHNINATSDLTQKADDNQDVHYSSISFQTKPESSIPSTDATESEDVHYATVKFR